MKTLLSITIAIYLTSLSLSANANFNTPELSKNQLNISSVSYNVAFEQVICLICKKEHELFRIEELISTFQEFILDDNQNEQYKININKLNQQSNQLHSEINDLTIFVKQLSAGNVFLYDNTLNLLEGGKVLIIKRA
ncbi:MAG: hypothetical protein JXR68_07050 [Bacteroidales bacterium]|nr:hypothetical protein [Bacteroidales bacterium]